MLRQILPQRNCLTIIIQILNKMASKVHVSETELFNVYKNASDTKIPLQQVLDAKFFQWINLDEIKYTIPLL